MLSVPTLWLVFVLNFAALGLVWAYVQRCYPNFRAARFWTAGTLCASAGAAVSLFRGYVDPAFPVLVGGGLLVFGGCLGAMGIRTFYKKPAAWALHIAVTAICVAMLAVFTLLYDEMAVRIAIYSTSQSLPLLLTLRLLLSRDGSPGARLTGYLSVMFVAVHACRIVASWWGFGGALTLVTFNTFQAALMVVLVFTSMAWNFGFLLMAIDRLRADVASLAMSDDLTGVANRRQLLQRLAEECARSGRGGEAFAVLAIDLDGFKAINDGHGHGAGDECLRVFTRAAQSRLRPGDLLSRSGGDEFCIVLPATTLREAAMVARHVIEACRDEIVEIEGVAISIGASIGIAQWQRETGAFPDRLIAEADQALYAAKKDGKNRYAVYDYATHGEMEREPLRKSA